MTKEIITITKLIADDGMVLTDGEHFGECIYLSEDANKSSYYEISQEEYEKLSTEQEEI